MDSNKNDQCCFNTNTHGRHVPPARSADIIETGCQIVKTVSAAKYQNQFNNNNLIEQENLMPPVKKDDPPAILVGQNGGGAVGLLSELHVKDKILAVNGSTRNNCAILPSSSSSSSSSVSVPRNASEERVPSGQLNVECLTNTTTTVITTSSFIPTVNGTNSTIPESLSRGSIADHSQDTLAAGAGASCEQKDELTLEAVVNEAGAGSGAPDEGEFSDNNSIGNLSYISENGLIEEIILLPNNAYSDDDSASTSDDCIYAYRGGEPGGVAWLPQELDQPPDDETDFLEMDFDPEPSSEMENFDSSQQEQVLEDDGLAAAASIAGRVNETQHLQEAIKSNSPTAAVASGRTLSPNLKESEPSQQSVARSPEPSLARNTDKQKLSLEDALATTSPLATPGPIAAVSVQKNTEGNATPDEILETIEPPSNELTQAHKTGAIPKTVPHHYTSPERDRTSGGGRGSSNAKNLKLDLNLCLNDIEAGDRGGGGAKRRYFDHLLYYEPQACSGQPWTPDKLVPNPEQSVNHEEIEFYCAECGNLEFTNNLWMVQEPDSWMCRNCTFTRDEKLTRRRADSFRPRTIDSNKKGIGPTLVECRSDAEAIDIRAEQIALEALSKINSLKETPASSGQLSWQEEQQHGRNRSIMAKGNEHESRDVLQDQEVPNPDNYHYIGVGKYPENTVTIYTINCSKQTIIEALTRIGIAPNLDVLRQYFNEQTHVDTSKMNIPQYLLYMSKRDCNYKKLIEAIKSCCDEETLDVQYFPFDPFSDMPEIVQISSCEIAKRWNANTNLRQIIHFKHKHFHTLNVLGKIVNIIRQPSRGRHTTHTIGIPQYYKSGSITITRLAETS
ncbi:hypothetical protein ZHAS_00006547 [Anopheles sinensis]|uniref:Uncharacterized protein n=1 Tax=Anopheles sinensis TaxID=74873 RepID=A0A084VML3_ANOSI|nr:hypothetical protein ZHAS_00006547 [Anopheles sinensis]